MIAPLLLAAALAAAAPPADAPPAPPWADGSTADAPPAKIIQLTVYGQDACPKSEGDEVVICGREPESERYRLPKRFRGRKDAPAAVSGSWANTVQSLEWVSKQGLPNSCSVIGSGGQTGCMQQFLRQSRAEREEDRRAAAGEQ
ncbi:MAG: hypothetical protein PGN09_13900 [Sphingomonas fennica]